MTMQVQGAVLRGTDRPLTLERLELADPGPGDVLIRMGAAGLCHTDLEVMRGAIAMPLPMVLGHEGAGAVEAVGDAVTGVEVGDHVVLSWNPACGRCHFCSRGQPLLCEPCGTAAGAGSLPDGRRPLSRDGEAVHQFMFMGSHADHSLVTAAAAVPVPRDLPFGIGAAIGCGITTGFVPARRADVAADPGAVIVVVGCGIVGLSAVLGARQAGAATIVAIDRSQARLQSAGRMGADVVVDVTAEDAGEVVRRRTRGRGADLVIESAGNADAMRTAFECIRPGGELTMLGKLGSDDELTLRFGTIMGNKTIRRLAYGGARPHRDFAGIAQLYLDGVLPLDELIDRRVALEDIDETFTDVEAGAVIRAVVEF
ncbi:MAG: alcohol dehydrogenase catalytic domain-containing protein [Candidatus Limnocylindrales bacterium]